jgi:chaperonin GroES
VAKKKPPKPNKPSTSQAANLAAQYPHSVLATAKPRADRVIIRLKSVSEAVSKGGIILPDSVGDRDKPMIGWVHAVGPGRPLSAGGFQAIELELGQRVLFSSYAGMNVENGLYKDKDFIIMREEDIVAVLADE